MQDRSTVGPRRYLSTAARRKHLFRTGVEKRRRRRRRREWRCDIGNKITTVRRARPLPSLSLFLCACFSSAVSSSPRFPPPIPVTRPLCPLQPSPDLAVHSLYSVLPPWNNPTFYKSFARSFVRTSSIENPRGFAPGSATRPYSTPMFLYRLVNGWISAKQRS